MRGGASREVVHRDLLHRELEDQPHRRHRLGPTLVRAEGSADDQGVKGDDEDERPDEMSSWLAQPEQTRAGKPPVHGARTLVEVGPTAHST